MSDRKYGLYKRIMKRDPKAIDEIETLEEAKEILKMVMGNTYLNGEFYQIEQAFINENLQRESNNTEIPSEEIVYDWNDAVEFIHDRCNLSRDIIDEVLELEEQYMESIGIVVKKEELTQEEMWNLDGKQRTES